MTTSWLRSRFAATLFVVAVVTGSAACGDDDDAPGDDGGTRDAAVRADGGNRMDGGTAFDAGHDVGFDAGPPDAGHDAGPPDAGYDASRDPAPPFRNPVALPDAELATQALRLLGAAEAGATAPRCRTCHALTRGRLRYWRALSDRALSTCLTDLAVSTDASAAAMLGCLRREPEGVYPVDRLGIWSTAADLPWFHYVFDHGVTGDPLAAHDAFLRNAGMPRGTEATPLSQAEFDVVAEWFIRGLPGLEDILTTTPPVTECLPGVSADVGTHVAAMATTGWAARNRAASMLMFGCDGATRPADCLARFPLASTTTSGAHWETVSDGVTGAHLRIVHTTTQATSYWTRSSPDGRFVAHGVASRLAFVDLTEMRTILGNALYDPTFFPDGSGFIVQDGRSPRICEMSVLLHSPTALTFHEAGCSSGGPIGLYEHVSTSLEGGDSWALDGTATYDDGGHDPTLQDPISDFGGGAASTVTTLINDGTAFRVGRRIPVAHPWEGDAVLSPSGKLLATRVGGPTSQLGYALHRIDVSGEGPTLAIRIPEIARYCLNGAKPELSYDERWLVTHHYIVAEDAVELGFTGPSDPGFAPYLASGGANIYLVDLLTGRRYRVTNMAPGQYAVFPHFRSDGWIYFMVRTLGEVPEVVVASDAALLAGG